MKEKAASGFLLHADGMVVVEISVVSGKFCVLICYKGV